MKPSEKWIDIEREKNVEKNVAGGEREGQSSRI